ncbi:MAG TPA: MFS transporter [Gaiellaceae bacterium]|nr:MFS transporter [Gaiellaceae bacterium]
MWRHRDFLSLWGAETISQFGTQVSLLALPLVAILVLEESAFKIAALTSVEFMPFLLFTLPAGVWVDRLRRKPILVLGNVGRAVALLSVPIVYWVGGLTIWQLYVVGFAVGTCTVFFDVAYQSYIPALVGREDVVEANSKLEISRAAANIAGPGMAGGLIALLTAPVAVLVDAVSYAISAVLLFGIRKQEEAPPRAERRSLRDELGEGLRYVFRNPYQRTMVVMTALSNFFGQVVFSILLVYAVRELDLSAATIGIALAIGNLGTLASALTAKRIGERLGVGRTILLASCLFGPGTLLIAFAPEAYALPLIVLAMMVIGFGGILYNVTAISLIQAITPDRILGRANASRRFVVWGVVPLGGFTGGALASTIGLRETMVVGALGGLLTIVPILVSPLRSVGKMSELEPLDPQSSPIASASSAPA